MLKSHIVISIGKKQFFDILSYYLFIYLLFNLNGKSSILLEQKLIQTSL